MGEARRVFQTDTNSPTLTKYGVNVSYTGYIFSVTSRLLILSLLATRASREPDGGRKYKVILIDVSGWALVPHTSWSLLLTSCHIVLQLPWVWPLPLCLQFLLPDPSAGSSHGDRCKEAPVFWLGFR